MTEVIGNCKINDQDMELKGTVEGNKVTFEAVNTTVSYNYEMNGLNIPLEMNVTYAVAGTLENKTLTLNGTCNGEGEIHLLIYNGTTSIDGTIGGSLEKQ
jgi:autotransporter translocation and assembly factor TamB